MSDVRSRQGGARVRLPPPLVFAAATAAGFFLPPRFGLPLGARLPLGGILIIAGFGVGVSAIGLFRKTSQDPRPWSPWRGLIFHGPSRFSPTPLRVTMVMLASGIILARDRTGMT